MATRTVLLVADDADQRELFTLALGNMGFSLQAVADSTAALAVLARQPVDLVLTDWMLPDLDGKALIGAIRRDFPLVRTVLMSSLWHVSTAARTIGADGWYRKGYSLSELQDIIRRLLEMPADTIQ
jgi:DNA-binding response OmpR family regulator